MPGPPTPPNRVVRLVEGPPPKPWVFRSYRVRFPSRLEPTSRRRVKRAGFNLLLLDYLLDEPSQSVWYLVAIRGELRAKSYRQPHQVRTILAKLLGVEARDVAYEEYAHPTPAPAGLCQHCWNEGRRTVGRTMVGQHPMPWMWPVFRDLCADHAASGDSWDWTPL